MILLSKIQDLSTKIWWWAQLQNPNPNGHTPTILYPAEIQEYFEGAFEDKDSLQRIDAGSIQICIPLVKNPNVLNGRNLPMLDAIGYGHNNIVKIMQVII